MANLTSENVSLIKCGYEAPAQLYSEVVVPFSLHPTRPPNIIFADYFDGRYWVAAEGPKIAWSTDLVNWTVVQDDNETNFELRQATAVGYQDGEVTAFPALGSGGGYQNRFFEAAVTVGDQTFTRDSAYYISGAFYRYFMQRSENTPATGQTQLLMQSDSTTSSWGSDRFCKSHGTDDNVTFLAARHESYRGGSGDQFGGFFASRDGGQTWASVIAGDYSNDEDSMGAGYECMDDGILVGMYDYSVDYDTRLFKFTYSGGWNRALVGTYPAELDWVRDIAYYNGKHIAFDEGTFEGIYWSESISSDIGDWTKLDDPEEGGPYSFNYYLANRNGKIITTGGDDYSLVILDLNLL